MKKNEKKAGIQNIKELFSKDSISGIKNIAKKGLDKLKSIKDSKDFTKIKENIANNLKQTTTFTKIKESLQNLQDKNESTRIITASVLIVLVIAILLLDSFFIIWLSLGAVCYIAIQESAKLYKLENNSDILYIVAAVIWILALFYPKPTDLLIVAIIVFVSIKAFMQYSPFKELYPILYPFAPMVFLLTLYINNGSFALFWLIVVVAICDISAYYVGRKFGKTKFCKTSPNKTTQGVIGGIAIATIIGTIVGAIVYSIFLAFIVSLFVSTASIFGDLFESYLKRSANVKDSGDILPGHGGVLDRIDGHLFGGVVMVILLGSFA